MYYLKPCNPHDAFNFSKVEKRASGLEQIDAIITYHHAGSGIQFKPSMAEVFAQIPPSVLVYVDAFKTEIVSEYPKFAFDGSGKYHKAITTLYKKSFAEGGRPLTLTEMIDYEQRRKDEATKKMISSKGNLTAQEHKELIATFRQIEEDVRREFSPNYEKNDKPIVVVEENLS